MSRDSSPTGTPLARHVSATGPMALCRNASNGLLSPKPSGGLSARRISNTTPRNGAPHRLVSISTMRGPRSVHSAAGLDDDDPEAYDNQAPAIPERIQSLPACIRVFLCALIFNTFRAKDDLSVLMRKVYVGVQPVIAIAIVLTVLSSLLRNEAFDTLEHVVNDVSQLVASLISVLIWAALKFHPSRHADATDGVLLANILSVCTAIITAVTFPAAPILFGYAVVALVLRSERLGVLLLVVLIAYVVSAYNVALMLPDARMPEHVAALPHAKINVDVTDRATLRFIDALYGAVVVAMVALQMRESARRAAVARSTLNLATSLAEALACYDTDSAAEKVEAARSSGDEVDVALLDSFQRIVDNLRKYRPHLPNWIVDATRAGEEDEDMKTATNDAALHCHPVAAIESGSDDEKSGAHSKDSHSGPQSFVSSLTSAMAVARASIAELHFSLSGAGRRTSVSPRRGSSVAPDESGMTALSPIHIADLANAFVDRVHKVVSSSSGAVHSFVGDTVRVSWNAASRAHQPEVKATRFLCRLKGDPAFAGLRLWGWTSFGTVRVQIAGNAQSQQALLLSQTTASDVSAACKALARRYGILVCDDLTASGAQHTIVLRGVGLHEAPEVPLTAIPATATDPRPPLRCTPLFEIVSEQDADQGDEWLYVLDRQSDAAKNPCAALCSAARQAAARDFSGAMALTTRVVAHYDAAGSVPPVVAAFHHYLASKCVSHASSNAVGLP